MYIYIENSFISFIHSTLGFIPLAQLPFSSNHEEGAGIQLILLLTFLHTLVFKNFIRVFEIVFLNWPGGFPYQIKVIWGITSRIL
jgi:hypothetical protein